MVSSVYNYYLAQYGGQTYNKHNAHKKDELRNLYNNIVKMSRAEPFYSPDISEDSQKLAIDIKESARSLFEITEDLTDASNGSMTFKSIATSSDPEIVDAEYIGENKSAGSSGGFSLSVKQLATPQVNTGSFVSPRARNLFTGTYAFDVNISSITYELQFQVKDGENNQDILNRISHLVNNSNIGLNADVVSDSSGKVALELTSNMTGVGSQPVIFTVSDEDSSALSGAVDAFGLNNTSHYPSNAIFNLNGNEKISSSNTFTVDRAFEVTLKDVTKDDETVFVGLKQNLDSLVDSLHELADSYNKIASVASPDANSGSRRLYSDLKLITEQYSDILAENGLNLDEDGTMRIDSEKLKDASDKGSLLDTLSQIGKYKNALQSKANAIMINPMEYIDKAVISYKNPSRPNGDPYSTSIYSGMMFNDYC